MDLQRGPLHAVGRLHAVGALSRRNLPVLSALAFVLAGTPAPAFAQISVEVSPLRVELVAGPGSTTTQAVTLTNGGKEPVRVRARLTDWELSRDGAPQFEGAKEGGPFSATDWVRIAPPEQVLDPGKEGTVRFSLAVPADARPAGYRTGILFEFSPGTGDPAARAREVQFRSRVATLIYINIGQPPVAIELNDLRIRPSAEQTHVVALLANTGKRNVRTKGTLTIFDAAGKEVAQTPIPDVPVLPESEREVAIVAFETAKPLPPGEYRVEVKIDVGMPALIVGETTLKVAR
jgi:P pilus assembly chaperone PapD